ncbi:C-type lectin BiL-like isoform X2 [Thamnophis elegans]|uniref:C-type lectin BiL-like isoform X2 n=1 Tax=Thamnophis elegans TaxID=35005 RepID=UPI001378C840|nr:C-type lectin BiL-like isoform X2 [Thamnophis elegans]
MGRFIFLTFSLLVVALSVRGAKGYQCPQDWLPGNGRCYKVFVERKTWTDAERFCRKLKPGCHLASIHSFADSFDLADYLTDYLPPRGPVWIGLWDPKKIISSGTTRYAQLRKLFSASADTSANGSFGCSRGREEPGEH